MVCGQQIFSTGPHVAFDFITPIVLIGTGGDTCVPIRPDLLCSVKMYPLMCLKVSLVARFV